MRKNLILSITVIGLLLFSMFAIVLPLVNARPTPQISVTTTTNKISANVGDIVTYTFKVTNTGGGTLFNIAVLSNPVGAVYASGDRRDNSKLESGETWIYSATYTVGESDPTTLTNTVTATGYTRKGEAYSDTDSYNIYIYGKAGNLLPDVLTSPNQEHNGGWYGCSVAMGEGLIVVGAAYESLPNPLYDPTLRRQTEPSQIYAAGRVYIYSATNGALLQTLKSPIPTSPGWFGYSVAVGEGVIVVGAPKETSGSVALAGKAYVFDADTLSLTPIKTLTSDYPVSNGDGQGYGVSVAVGNGIIAVGSSAETVGTATLAGRVYLYDTAGNELSNPPLQSPAAQYPGRFGWSVALTTGTLVVGAPYEDIEDGTDTIDGAGKVYTYNTANGQLTDTIISPNAEFAGHFGFSLAVGSGKVAIGAFDETVEQTVDSTTTSYEEAGRAYVYDLTTKAIVYTLESQNPENHGLFGYSVAIGDGVIVVGAIIESSGSYPDAGNAYVFNAATGAYSSTLTNLIPALCTEFGWSVAAGSDIIVGGYDAVFIFE